MKINGAQRGTLGRRLQPPSPGQAQSRARGTRVRCEWRDGSSSSAPRLCLLNGGGEKLADLNPDTYSCRQEVGHEQFWENMCRIWQYHQNLINVNRFGAVTS